MISHTQRTTNCVKVINQAGSKSSTTSRATRVSELTAPARTEGAPKFSRRIRDRTTRFSPKTLHLIKPGNTFSSIRPAVTIKRSVRHHVMLHDRKTRKLIHLRGILNKRINRVVFLTARSFTTQIQLIHPTWHSDLSASAALNHDQFTVKLRLGVCACTARRDVLVQNIPAVAVLNKVTERSSWVISPTLTRSQSSSPGSSQTITFFIGHITADTTKRHGTLTRDMENDGPETSHHDRDKILTNLTFLAKVLVQHNNTVIHVVKLTKTRNRIVW